MTTQAISERSTQLLQESGKINKPELKKYVKPNPNEYTIFCVDDSKVVLTMLKYSLNPNPNFDIHIFETGEDAIENLYQLPDIIILDFHLSTDEGDKSNLDGLGVLEKVKEISPNSKVIMLSSQDSISVAVSCLKKGAIDYIIKDQVMKINVEKAINNIIKSIELKREIQNLSQKIKRDKLLIKGYFTIFICMSLLILYLFFPPF